MFFILNEHERQDARLDDLEQRVQTIENIILEVRANAKFLKIILLMLVGLAGVDLNGLM